MKGEGMGGYADMFYAGLVLFVVSLVGYGVLRIYLHGQKKRLEEGDEG